MATQYTIPRKNHIPHIARPHERGQPSPSSINPANIPQELRDLPQWANWYGDKVIRNPHTYRNGSSTNPASWTTFDHAYQTDPNRLAFVFARRGGIVGIDGDGCRNAKTGELDERGQALLQQFPHIYWEVSLSGNGLHGIGYGELPEEQSGRHPQGIGIFHHSRYFVMTGNPIPDYKAMGAYGDNLAAWYLDHFAPPTKTTPAAPVTLTMGDQDIIERLRNEKNGQGIAGPLLDGDKDDYPDYSTARYALANKVAFYSDDAEQIARILRSSNLFRDDDDDRERDRKAQGDATKALREYTGPRYAPNHGTTPRLTVVPKTPPSDDADSDTRSKAELRAELDNAYATIAEQGKTIAQKDEQIIVLQEHIRRRDERDAIHRNKKLGAASKTAAVLANLFREEQPKEPGSPTGWRMPLQKLAERSGLSADRSGDHLDQIATFKTDDGTPVLLKETRNISRTVDQETGEIIEAHREVWVGPGPGIDPAEFGAILATLAPSNAPKHGGAPDRNKCPDCPNAGVNRRSQTMRRITYECACCKKVLDTDIISVGRETTQYLPPIGSTDPIRHDAGLLDSAPDDTSEPAPHPIRHLAPSIDNHTPEYLSGILPDSPSPVVERRTEPAEPAWMWDSPPDDATGPSPGWQDERRRAYGEVYRGEETG